VFVVMGGFKVVRTNKGEEIFSIGWGEVETSYRSEQKKTRKEKKMSVFCSKESNMTLQKSIPARVLEEKKLRILMMDPEKKTEELGK